MIFKDDFLKNTCNARYVMVNCRSCLGGLESANIFREVYINEGRKSSKLLSGKGSL